MTKKEIKFSKKPGAATPPAEAIEAWINTTRGGAEVAIPAAPPPAEEPMKRLTIDLPESLHVRVKSQCAKRGTKMADAIRLLLEEHFPKEG